jgi:hypothetical protein
MVSKKVAYEQFATCVHTRLLRSDANQREPDEILETVASKFARDRARVAVCTNYVGNCGFLDPATSVLLNSAATGDSIFLQTVRGGVGRHRNANVQRTNAGPSERFCPPTYDRLRILAICFWN